MTKAPDGRSVILAHEANNPDRLTDAITASGADLFERDGCTVWCTEGKLVGVGRDALIEIVAKYVATKKLVNRGTEDKPNWKVEYQAIQPDEATLRALLKDGSALIARLPKAGATKQLTPQQVIDARRRSLTGERPEQLAAAYHVDVEVIRQAVAR